VHTALLLAGSVARITDMRNTGVERKQRNEVFVRRGNKTKYTKQSKTSKRQKKI
jgi:hypothetical protein